MSLSPSTKQTIAVGSSVAFTATVTPDNATDKKVTWSVGGENSGAVKLYSNEACTTEVGTDATSTLTVYAKGITEGSATVTATSNSDNTESASCAVTVLLPHTHAAGTPGEGITFQPWTSSDGLPDTEGNYYLTEDVTLSSTWEVPVGETSLCLNGHGIKFIGKNICVIYIWNNRTLNLYDCDTSTKHSFTVSGGLATIDGTFNENNQTFTGGYITGGNNSGNGGGVSALGTFNMYGGTIIGNNGYYGGGVDVASSATFNMEGGSIMYNTASRSGGGVNTVDTVNIKGGSIENNTAGVDGGGVNIGMNGKLNMTGGLITENTANGSEGGGVWVSSGGQFTVSGAPKITRNTTKNATKNVFLASTSKITVNGSLKGEDDSKANIGVTMESSGVFTSGWSTKMESTSNPADYFFSDKDDYGVKETTDTDREAQLLTRATITTKPTAINTAKDSLTDDTEHALLKDDGMASGAAGNGRAFAYALGNADGPTEEFSSSIPKGKDVQYYYVWVKAIGDDTHSDSKPEHVVSKIYIPVTFKVVGGEWGDETGGSDDKVVELSRYENEDLLLVLQPEDIPAVGGKPSEGYKDEGAWDEDPHIYTKDYSPGGKAVSEAKTFTYKYVEKPKISAKVTFKVVNGSWDDGKTEDKQVTLNGHEGDTLKLAADQIPAVGSKPDSGYEAGSWDVAPDTETAITADKEYTYTYKKNDPKPPSKTSISNAKVVLSAAPLVYNGEDQSPEILTIGGRKLRDGIDYSIMYMKDGSVVKSTADAGTYTMIINGKGNYAGSTRTEFTIESQDLDGDEIVLESTAFVFDGTAHLPVIKTIGGKTLVEGKDFDVRYTQGGAIIEEPTDAGAYTMTITGKGNYKGSASTDFEISKAASTMTAKGRTVKIKSKTKKLKKTKTISAKKAYNIKDPAGEVTYRKVKANKSSGKFKVDPETGKITVKKGLKRGTYKLTVNVTDPGSSNYDAAETSVVVKITIKK